MSAHNHTVPKATVQAATHIHSIHAGGRAWLKRQRGITAAKTKRTIRSVRTRTENNLPRRKVVPHHHQKERRPPGKRQAKREG